MAKLVGGDDAKRAPSLRGRVYIYGTGQDRVVASWPRSRPGNQSVWQLHGQELMRQAAAAVKVTTPDQIAWAMEITKGTRFLWRDVLYKCLYARLPKIILEDGTRLVPMPTRVNISELLDNVDWTPGTMLFRGDRYWLPVPPGANGDVLRFTSVGTVPVWGPPTGGLTTSVCVVNKTSNDTAANSWPKFPSWSGMTLHDYTGWASGNPDRLTAPLGVSRCRLMCNINLTADGTARSFAIGFEKNGSGGNDPNAGGFTIRQGTAGFTNNQFEYISPWLAVSPGDYYRVRINVSPTYSAGLLAGSFFQMEVA